jgi:hypothetical protein
MTDAISTPAPTEPTPTPAQEPASQTSSNPTQPESLLGKDLAPEVKPAEPTGEKPEEKPAEAAPAPEPFTLEKVTLPENIQLSDEDKTALTEIATKHGLKPEAASELLAMHAKTVQAAQTASMQAWYDTQSKWVGEIKSDPEFAGEKLQQAQSVIAKALEEYGDKEVRAAFDLTGAGSNPAIFKTFYKMAKALGEGSMTQGGNPATGGQKSLAERFYPNLSNNG